MFWCFGRGSEAKSHYNTPCCMRGRISMEQKTDFYDRGTCWGC